MKKIAPKKTVAKTAAPAAKLVAPAPVAPKFQMAPVAKPAPQAPSKKPAAQTTRTVITANVDVGFGNALYIRGEGPGLSWDKGLVMDCASDAQWTVTLSDAIGPVVFKFLVNDITWCVGADYSVAPGAKVTFEPAF
jgi:hypothetical protein